MATSPFSVYVIESPSARDLMHGRSEGEILKRILSLAGISCSYRLAVDAGCFAEALVESFVGRLSESKDAPASVIHLSAHGDKDGFTLTSGERVNWGPFGNVLRLVNQAFDGRLLLAMSSCEGMHGIQMAIAEAEGLPFYAIVSHTGKPNWSATAIGYATFYHLLAVGKTLQEALVGMQAASAEAGFQCAPGRTIQETYASMMAGVDTQVVEMKLRESTRTLGAEWLKGAGAEPAPARKRL